MGIPESFDEHFKIMFDLQVLAFRAEITRVATMMFARDTSGAVYPQSGVREGFHVASHHSNNRANMDKFALINKYHVQLLAYFLEKLQATPDGDGNLLDHSLILYGSSMSNGNQHDHDPLPVVLAGGASGQLKGGRHMQYAAAHADVESAADDARQARRSGGSAMATAPANWRFENTLMGLCVRLIASALLCAPQRLQVNRHPRRPRAPRLCNRERRGKAARESRRPKPRPHSARRQRLTSASCKA